MSEMGKLSIKWLLNMSQKKFSVIFYESNVYVIKNGEIYRLLVPVSPHNHKAGTVTCRFKWTNVCTMKYEVTIIDLSKDFDDFSD